MFFCTLTLILANRQQKRSGVEVLTPTCCVHTSPLDVGGCHLESAWHPSLVRENHPLRYTFSLIPRVPSFISMNANGANICRTSH